MELHTLSRFLRLPIAWFGVALVVMLWFGIAFQAHSEFQAARRSAHQDLNNYTRVFDEHIVRTVRELDKALLIARRGYLDTLKDRSYEAAIGQPLPDPALLSDMSFQMATIDRHGLLRATTIGNHPPERIDLADRTHFQVHKSGRPDKPYISKPVLGRWSGRWSLQLTRRIEGPDGSFDGVLVASMDPDHFGRFYGSLDLGREGTVVFAGLDGVVRVGRGSETLQLGKKIHNTELLDHARKGGGVHRGDMDGSGQQKVYAIRLLNNHPLFVSVGISPDEVFASANSNSTRYWIVGVVVTLIVLFAVVASIRHHLTIAHMARYDDLTGLPNRAHFREMLTGQLAERSGSKPFTLFLVDVDKFKAANDTFGHKLGDKLLCATSDRMKKAVRTSDMVARLGGDEFAIILPNIQEDRDVSARAKAMLNIIREPIIIDEQRIIITGSIGCVTVTEGGTSFEELLMNADLALYEAKSAGRNCHCIFEPEMAQKFAERRQLEQDLRDAAEAKQLQLHYQPIRSLQRDAVCGFEVVLRWHHPRKGWITPATFVPIAEESGLIIQIGEWVLKEACKQAQSFANGERIAVNLSSVQFHDPDLGTKINDALETSGLAPERLELEITESLMMDATPEIINTIKRLRGRGIRIVMDDFGTGYSSLGYLSKFDFDKIKIDRSFVQGLNDDDHCAAIIRAVVQLADSLGVTTTAEGVETLSQLESLTEMGCGEAQGFLFSPPKPADKLKDFIDLTSPDEARNGAQQDKPYLIMSR